MNSGASSGAAEQAKVTRRYNRMARIYDLYDAPMELMGTKKRRGDLIGNATGIALEVGVGTGKNLRYYPVGVQVTGIDVSSQMLKRAKDRLAAAPVHAELIEADVQDLPFDDDTFDTAVVPACSVLLQIRCRVSASSGVWCARADRYCCSSMSDQRTDSLDSSPMSLADSPGGFSDSERTDEPRRMLLLRALRSSK
jgi:ubiquinone/menaquinone biosynthesis C-methylase UbiE